MVLSVAFIWTQQGLTVAEERGREGVKYNTKITTYRAVNMSPLCTYLFKVCGLNSNKIVMLSACKGSWRTFTNDINQDATDLLQISTSCTAVSRAIKTFLLSKDYGVLKVFADSVFNMMT